MASGNLERVREIFLQCIELPLAERSPFLKEACGSDAALLADVESLLANASLFGGASEPRGGLDAGEISAHESGKKPTSSRAPVRPGALASNGAAAEHAQLLHAPAVWQTSTDEDVIPPPGARPRITHLGSYHILEELGRGGMGTVYKAEQREPVRRTVAIKLIKPGFDSAAVILRFEAERQALARMDHPHIAKVLDAGSDEKGRPYFVMEYVPGVAITEFADAHSLSIYQRLELFIQVCDAVAHAHAKSLIHRDIKASNVLAYMNDGKPFIKIIDFGIVKALEGERLTQRTLNTGMGIVIGTYGYMSPEQAEGSTDIDTRTDVYSLGVLLYELLTGAPPFDPEVLNKAADEEVRRIINQVDPPRPSDRLLGLGERTTQITATRKSSPAALIRQLRSELEWIPLKAIRKERERRYASPLQLADDIRNYMENRPLIAGPESNMYRLRKFISKRRVPVLATAAMILALAIGAAGTTMGFIGQRNLRIRAEALRSQAEAAAQQEREAKEALRAQESQLISAKEQAELRLADGQVAQADALALAGRRFEANTLYEQAYDQYIALHVSPTQAEQALCLSMAASPPAVLTMDGHYDVLSVAISPDGRTALSTHLKENLSTGPTGYGDGRTALSAHLQGDKVIKVWDLITGRELRTLTGHTGRVQQAVYSPDGRTALSGGYDKTLKLWDLTTGKVIRTFTGHTDAVTTVAFTHDGHTALSGSADKTIKLWDLATGGVIRAFTGHTDAVTSVAVSPDGRTVLSGSFDRTVKLWDLASGREIRTFTGHYNAVMSVAFSPDGRTALSGSRDRTLRLWDLTTGKEVHTFRGHIDTVCCVAFRPDGRTAISSSWDQTLKLWDLATGNEIYTYSGHRAGARFVALSPDGRIALSGSWDHTLKVWDLSPSRDVRTIDWNTIGNVAVSPDGRTALAGTNQGVVSLWDLATGKKFRSIALSPPDWIYSVAYSPDGRSALLGGEYKTIKLWDLATGNEIRTFTGHSGAIFKLAFSPDGRTAISASADKTLKLWNLATGEVIRTFAGHTDEVHGAAISPDGRTLLSGSWDQTLKLWDLATGKEIRTFTGHTGPIMCIAISPDGRTALSASKDYTIKLWDLATGKEIRTFLGHNDIVQFVAFCPDGRTAASGSQDRTLKFWDISTGKEIRFLTGHPWVSGIAFTPDGGTLVSGTLVGPLGDYLSTLKVWGFSRPATYRDFETKVPQAQAALQKNPDDPAALVVLGNWYAFRGLNEWAVELLERAHAGGAPDEPLTLARCYWQLADELTAKSRLTRAGCLAAAARQFAKAITVAKDDKERKYLSMCAAAVQTAAAGPTSAP